MSSFPFTNYPFDGRIGRGEFTNDENVQGPITLTVWHPDTGQPFRTYDVDSGTTLFLNDPNGNPVNMGNNWGVQVGGGQIKPVGVVANFNPGLFAFTTTEVANIPFFDS